MGTVPTTDRITVEQYFICILVFQYQFSFVLFQRQCTDLGTTKCGRVNQKVITMYVKIQPQIVDKRIEEVNKMQADLVSQVQTATLEQCTELPD